MWSFAGGGRLSLASQDSPLGGESALVTSITQAIYQLKHGVEGYLLKIRQLINAKTAV